MPRPTEATEEVVREVMRFYFRERLGTIKCAAHAFSARARRTTSASTAKDGDEWGEHGSEDDRPRARG